MRVFAKLNKNNEVENVIIASLDMINSGMLGNSINYIETEIEPTHKKEKKLKTKKYAGLGDVYDNNSDEFVKK